MTIPNINIFIDTSEVYNDPFFKKTHNRLLLKFSELYGIPIFMSKVVYDEAKNNFSKNVKKRIGDLENALEKLNDYYPQQLNTESINKSLSDFVESFDSFYTDLIDRDIIEILEYEDSLLPELVNRSINRIKPFTEKKQEFRDAITWLTYAHKAEKEKLEFCYLISHNVNDFMNSEKTDLHADLLEDTKRIKFCKSSKHFFDDGVIASHTKSVELHQWIEENPFDKPKLTQLINTKFDDIHTYTSRLLYEDPSSLINEDEDAVGELGGIDIEDITYFDTEVIADEIIIQGYITVEADIDVSIYKMYRDKGDDVYAPIGLDTANLSYNFAISYNKDDNTIENFEIIDWEVLNRACVTKDWHEYE